MKLKGYGTWIALGAGVVALYAWYRSRSGLPVWPIRAAAPRPPGGVYAEAPGPNRPPSGPVVLPAPGGRTINDPDIVRARGAAAGSGSRAVCSQRWIKTIDPPYYGFCVDESTLNYWNSVAGSTAQYATSDDVKRILGGMLR